MSRDESQRGRDGLPRMPRFGWATSGKLITYNKTQQVTLQAQFPEADVYTVQFGFSGPSTPPANPIQAIATVIWTVAGNQVIRKYSVANGVSVSGNGEAVRILINDGSIERHAEATPIPIEYGVSVSVVRGVRPANQQPAILVDVPPVTFGAVYVIHPLSSVKVPVPQDVGVISVYVAVAQAVNNPAVPLPDQAVLVAQDQNGAFLKVYDPRNFEWVPLYPNTDTIQIFNAQALGTTDILATVTFGVDG
jgi:hypothetical protein